MSEYAKKIKQFSQLLTKHQWKFDLFLAFALFICTLCIYSGIIPITGTYEELVNDIAFGWLIIVLQTIRIAILEMPDED